VQHCDHFGPILPIVEELTPLANNPGRFVVSTHRLYFQPFNNLSATTVVKYELRSIERVLKRRYLLRHVCSF